MSLSDAAARVDEEKDLAQGVLAMCDDRTGSQIVSEFCLIVLFLGLLDLFQQIVPDIFDFDAHYHSS